MTNRPWLKGFFQWKMKSTRIKVYVIIVWLLRDCSKVQYTVSVPNSVSPTIQSRVTMRAWFISLQMRGIKGKLCWRWKTWCFTCNIWEHNLNWDWEHKLIWTDGRTERIVYATFIVIFVGQWLYAIHILNRIDGARHADWLSLQPRVSWRWRHYQCL